MKVTAKVSKLNGDGKVKAIASIIIEDAFKVDNIRVVEGEKDCLFQCPKKTKQRVCRYCISHYERNKNLSIKWSAITPIINKALYNILYI